MDKQIQMTVRDIIRKKDSTKELTLAVKVGVRAPDLQVAKVEAIKAAQSLLKDAADMEPWSE